MTLSDVIIILLSENQNWENKLLKKIVFLHTKKMRRVALE